LALQSENEAPARFTSRESDASDLRAIQEFLDEALITEVLEVMKSGKEATVYRCRAHRSLGVKYAAAKVYHEQAHRTFQHANVYEEGRVILEGQVRRAVAKKTGFGRQAQGAMWVNHEFDVLSALNYAGADVPAPYACNDRAILLEFVGDGSEPADQLQHAELTPDEAPALFERVLWNIELFMRENVVHADLSAFNMLYLDGKVTVIDFPQAVDPRQSAAAPRLLERDIRNVLSFFSRHGAGLDLDAATLARNLWDLWKFGEL
jgi:RIO kinase 1